MGITLSAFTGYAWAGPLEDYMSHPPAFDNPPWHPENEPSLAIPRWLKQFREGKTDTEKAIAVGNLVVTAGRMAGLPEAQAAALQLMDQHVMPNLDVTKRVEISLFCSWRGIVIDCANIYKKLGKLDEQRKCLELYITGVDKPVDRDSGLYMLAHWHAAQENYAQAIKAMEKIRDDGNRPQDKKYYIPLWTKKLAQNEKEALENKNK